MLSTMPGERPVAPRRVQVLAIIVENIARYGVCPCYDEIGRAMVPQISKTRVKQHVDALVRLKCIDHPLAAQRGIRIRDLNRCRQLIEARIGQPHWWPTTPPAAPDRAATCTTEQLPLVPPFEHLPDLI